MSGARRPGSRALDVPAVSPSEQLASACALRDEWLGHGLAAQPADRARAEDAVTRLYRLVDAPPPRFEWVPSPAAARRLILGDGDGDGPRKGADGADGADGVWRLARFPSSSVAARLASLVSDLRDSLDRAPRHRRREWWRVPRVAREVTTANGPEEALDAGVPLDTVIDTTVRDTLGATLRDAVCAPMRTAFVAGAGDALGLAWYGQQDAAWIGHHDTRLRSGITCYPCGDRGQLEIWAELARSTGWWWPSEGRCVMAERPVAVHTEASPQHTHGALRLHREDGPAVRFADGEELHSLHGALVPEWVVTDPTVERIHQEPNIEVRRSAIERIGWDSYVEQAELGLVATAADPGNPGAELRLYHVPQHTVGAAARLLLAVNGSPEPDGRHRRYGLRVPPYIDDPLAAAGWSYGLSGRQYAQLVRRT